MTQKPTEHAPIPHENEQNLAETEPVLHEIRCVFCKQVFRHGPKVLSAACTPCLERRQRERRGDTDFEDYLSDLRSHLDRKQRNRGRLKPLSTTILVKEGIL